jgi:biotin carboxyl carrier protein
MGTSATKAASEMNSAMLGLKSEGKLTSNRAVSVAIRKVIDQNSTRHEIPAPMGARVIAVHKFPGDLVRAGDKIVTLELNGKRIPILAKQDGIMQTINVSKGGVIGNSRPRAARHMPQQGAILITFKNI